MKVRVLDIAQKEDFEIQEELNGILKELEDRYIVDIVTIGGVDDSKVAVLYLSGKKSKYRKEEE